METHLVLAALAVCLALCPASFADSLQKKYEGEVAAAATAEKLDAVLDASVREGLAFPPGKDLASYLAECREACARMPAAWARYVEGVDKDSRGVEPLRKQFLDSVGLPLSDAFMSLARHYLQGQKRSRGYPVELSETFHQDLDRAIVYKNASALQAYLLPYLAKADLDADAKDPAAAYRALLAGMAREVGGYTVPDYKDIFYYQAPDASADYIDEEIFSLYRTLKEQKAAVDPIVRLVDDVAGPGETPFPERRRRLQRILGALAFGAGPSGHDAGTPPPASLAGAKAAVTGWALKQGLMRTMLFGEHLACEYARCLQMPEGLEKLRALQKQLRKEPGK